MRLIFPADFADFLRRFRRIKTDFNQRYLRDRSAPAAGNSGCFSPLTLQIFCADSAQLKPASISAIRGTDQRHLREIFLLRYNFIA
jgi:hypothetical protein